MKILTTRSLLRHTLETGRRVIFEPGGGIGTSGPPTGPGPYITSISPNIGSPNFGQYTIIITGGNFAGASAVAFVAQGAVDSFVVNSRTQITVTTNLYGRQGDPVDNLFVTAADGVTTSPITPATDFWYAWGWPEEVSQWPIAVNASRMWTASGSSWAYNLTSSPARYITSADTNTYSTWPTGANSVEQILLDANYAYYISSTSAVITRVPLTATSTGATFSGVQTLQISAGISPNGSMGGSGFGTGVHANGCISGNYMYLVWTGSWAGSGSSSPAYHPKLLVIDLVAWSPTGYNVYNITTGNMPTGVPEAGPYGVQVVNGVIVISSMTPSGWTGSSWSSYQGQLYYSTVASPGTFSHVNLTYIPAYGTSSGNIAYFLENSWSNVGTNPINKHLIMADCTSGTPVISYVDLTADDINIKWLSWDNSVGVQQREAVPWVSGSHVFIPCNTVTNTGNYTAYPAPFPYLARRVFSTGATAGGVFMNSITPWTWEMWPAYGAFYGSTNYIQMKSFDYDSRLVTASESLTSPQLYPVPSLPVPPANDLFANAITLSLGMPVTGYCYYATREASEQYPPVWDVSVDTAGNPLGANKTLSIQYVYGTEHTIWYKFTPSSTGDYAFTMQDQSGSSRFDLTLWTGSTIGSLTNIYQIQNGDDLSAPWVATVHLTSGTLYHAALDRYFYFSRLGTSTSPAYNSYSMEDPATLVVNMAAVAGASPSFVNAGAQAVVTTTTSTTVTPVLPGSRVNGNLLIAFCRLDVNTSLTVSGGSWVLQSGTQNMGPYFVLATCWVNGSEVAPVFQCGTHTGTWHLTAQVIQYTNVASVNIGRPFGWAFACGWYSSVFSAASDGGTSTPVRCPAATLTTPYSTLLNLTMYHSGTTPSTPTGFTSRDVQAGSSRISDQSFVNMNSTVSAITLPETPADWSCLTIELRSQ